MEAMNGMTADKTLKTTRMIGELGLMTIAADVGITIKITVDLEKKIDVPREMDGNPPEKGIGTAVTAGPGTMTMIPAPKKNTIVSVAAVVTKRTKMEKHLALKY